MEITINKPTTEWCRECGAEFHYSRYNMRCKCQECGSESMSRGIKPVHSDVIGCYSYQGRFNLLSDEQQWQYVFTNLPRDIYKTGRKCFVVDDELSTDDPFELAVELKSIYDGYFISTSKKEIDDLVSLFNDDFRDQQYAKKQDNRKQELLAELYWLMK